MNNQKQSFIFYRSFYEALKTLSHSDRSILYEAIVEYALNQTEIELPNSCKGMFYLIKPQLNANQKRYENGKSGGRPAKPKDNQKETGKKPKDNLDESKAKPNANVNANGNDNDDVLNLNLPVPKEPAAAGQKVLFAGRVLNIFEDKFFQLQKKYPDINLDESLKDADRFFEKQKSTQELDKRLDGFLKKIADHDRAEKILVQAEQNQISQKRLLFEHMRNQHIDNEEEKTFKENLLQRLGDYAFNQSFSKALIFKEENRMIIVPQTLKELEWIDKVHLFEVRQSASDLELKHKLLTMEKFTERYGK